MLRDASAPVLLGRDAGRLSIRLVDGVELVELTASDADAASAAFALHASAEERQRAHRLPPGRARVFVHAHGALRLRPDARHRSISYADGRAWAAFAASPVGLDVVAASDDGALDGRCVGPGDEAACAGLGFPPRLAAWAAKEAAAKLTGEVGREPERWRLDRSRDDVVHPGAERAIALRFVRPAQGLLAAVARYRPESAR